VCHRGAIPGKCPFPARSRAPERADPVAKSKYFESGPGDFVKSRGSAEETLTLHSPHPEDIERDDAFLALCPPLSAGLGALSVLIGFATLAGWIFGIEPLLWAPRDMIVMKANAALCFTLAGFSLVLLGSGHRGPYARAAAGAMAGVVALVGLVTLAEYATGWNAGIDQLLAVDPPGGVKTLSPGRMAPNVTVTFVLLGSALLLLSLRVGDRAVSILGFLAGLFALHGLMGFSYAPENSRSFLNYTHIAFHTAFALMALTLGTLLALGERGMMEPLSRRTVGAAQARWMLPAMVFVPFLLAWLRHEGTVRGRIEDEFGVAIMVAASSAAMAILVWSGLLKTNRAALERQRAFEALKAEERFRKGIEESILTGIVATDTGGRVAYVNPEFCRLVGREPEELLGGGPPYLFTHPRERRSVFEIDTAARVGIFRQDECEFLFRRSDGKAVVVSAFMSRLRDDRGHVLGTLAAVTDVTARKQQERRLAQTTEVLERIFANVQSGIAYLDRGFRFLRVNKAFADTFGRPPEAFLGRKHADLFPDSADLPVFRRVFATGETHAAVSDPFVIPGREAEGPFHRDWTVQPVKARGGATIGVILWMNDVTQRVRAEAGLKESEQRLDLSVTAAGLGLWDWDITTGRAVYNEQWAAMLGYTLADLGSGFSDWEQLIHPDDRAGVIASLVEHINGTMPVYEAEFRMKAKSGGWRWIRSRGMVSDRDDEGKPVRATGVHQDITKAREMEEAMLRQEKMATLGQMAAGIAHEIRNPLSGLNLYLASAEKVAQAAEFEEPAHRETLLRSISTARAASVKIEGVIRRVMDFVRPVPMRLVPVDLNKVVAEALEMVAATGRQSGVALSAAFGEGLPACRADAPLIEQMTLNLITNAIQATEKQPGERRVEISTGAEGASLFIRVGDSGPGIAEGNRRRIFDPFYTTKAAGTGLGLSITSRIVAEHGGSIEVGRSPLGGAEFTVRLFASKER
jgi:PAS domain S-box-containing protein